MKNRVYYGQYSLKYWIELMLSKNIICPPYQRRFVWKEPAVRNFIQTIKNDDLFVPPITIGVVSHSAGTGESEKINYIIDGQQRLTSILLAYLKVFPKPVKEFMDGNDDDSTDINLSKINHLTNWQFDRLLSLPSAEGKTITQLAIESGSYKDFTINDLNEDFLSTHYLGYSYIVPDTDKEDIQSAYFSKLFNTLNAQGTPLTSQQSRLALYFLSPKLESWFNPQFCKSIYIHPKSSKRAPVDFVRYISILSDYYCCKKKSNVLNGYDSRGGEDGKLKTYEDYYRDYIYSVFENTDDERFGNFRTIFGNRYTDYLSALEIKINELGINRHQFATIADVDFYFFGLVYYTVFKRQNIDVTKKDKLIGALNKYIEKYKKQLNGKNVSNVENLRQRIQHSINIYSHYINH